MSDEASFQFDTTEWVNSKTLQLDWTPFYVKKRPRESQQGAQYITKTIIGMIHTTVAVIY